MSRDRLALHAATQWITELAIRHPHDLVARLAERLGVGRPAARRVAARLCELQWLSRSGTPRRPHHAPGLQRQVVARYLLDGLQEDLPWAQDFAPFFALPAPVARLAQHAFTELLNNAIDHSGGTTVTVSMRQTPSHLQLLVADDGRGLFHTIARDFGIDDAACAALELSKGRLSSQPQRHSGRGLYFTSRLADVFDLHANDAAFQRRAWDEGCSMRPRPPGGRSGTAVFVGIALDTERTLDEVMRAASLDGAGYGFEVTRVPLRLLAAGTGALASRAQARRVAARLADFRRAEVDFAGLDEIGHAFADELFRVLAADRPGTELRPLNMSPRVAAMVASVIPPGTP